jgi:hypothetical protein
VRNEELKSGDSEPSQPNGSGSPLRTPESLLLTPHSSLLIHSFRLGPPWQVTPTAGGARHARKFGRPRTLDADERLWLVCEHVPGPAEVRVNGTGIGVTDAPGPFAADITSILQPRNEVIVAVASGEPLGSVRLEVRSA